MGAVNHRWVVDWAMWAARKLHSVGDIPRQCRNCSIRVFFLAVQCNCSCFPNGRESLSLGIMCSMILWPFGEYTHVDWTVLSLFGAFFLHTFREVLNLNQLNLSSEPSARRFRSTPVGSSDKSHLQAIYAHNHRLQT